MNPYNVYLDRVFEMYMQVHPDCNPEKVRQHIQDLTDRNFKNIPCQLNNNITQETIDYLAAKNVGIAYANPTEEPNDIITMFTTDKNLYCTRVTSRVFPAGKLLYSSATELRSEVVSVT